MEHFDVGVVGTGYVGLATGASLATCAHAAVVVTEWEEVRDLDPKKTASLMREPKLIVDGRNALDAPASKEAGLLYRGF